MPVTRGGAQSTPASLSSNSDVSETDVSQQYSVNIDSLIAPLSGSLSTLDDNAVVHGREAKVLRDATSAAISQVWNDARSQTSSLASSINESTLALSRRLNDSFSAVGDRLESTPMVATLGADGSLPGVRSFSGLHRTDPPHRLNRYVRSCEACQRKRSHGATREKMIPVHANAIFHKRYTQPGLWRRNTTHDKVRHTRRSTISQAPETLCIVIILPTHVSQAGSHATQTRRRP
ncbi:hypothetical protein Q1695_006009 [Nippostrongylus brasiliensis]|nr:hypothetical protein Q1695_006009 [Nippostrongylus brasiliensis]